MVTSYSTLRLLEHMQLNTNDGIIPIFLSGSRNRFEQLVYDRLVPFKNGNLWESTAQRVDHSMRSTGLRSLEYAGRDFGENLEVWHWMNDRVGGFLSRSIGSVDEELIDPLDPSYQVAERSFWAELRESGNIHFLLRPINSSPYASVAGRWKVNGDEFLFTNLRCYYSHLRDPKVELVVGIPVYDGFSATIGTSYTYHVDDSSNDSRVVARLERDISSGKKIGYWYIGFELNQVNKQIRSGLSLWF
jgi:hypothetical protein